jgi:hypothetical protein
MKPAIEPVMRMRPWPRRPHVSAYLLQQIDRTGNICIDNVAHGIEVLVQETFAKAAPSIRKQCFNRSAANRCIQFVHALNGGQVGFNRIDRGAQITKLGSRGIDRGFVRRHQ